MIQVRENKGVPIFFQKLGSLCSVFIIFLYVTFDTILHSFGTCTKKF